MSTGKQGTPMGVEYTPEKRAQMDKAKRRSAKGVTRAGVVARDLKRKKANFTPEYQEWLARKHRPG